MKNIFWSAILFLHMFLFLGEIKFDDTTGKLKLDLTRGLNYQQGHNSLYSFANVKKGIRFYQVTENSKNFVSRKSFIFQERVIACVITTSVLEK